MLANVLVGQAASELVEESQGLPATGPSFRDATRVAGANPPLWRDIFVSNREAIVRELDAYAAALETVRERLRAGDGEALERWIEDARADRQRLLEGELAGGPVSELRVRSPTSPASWPRSRSRSARPDQHRRHGPLPCTGHALRSNRTLGCRGGERRAGRGARRGPRVYRLPGGRRNSSVNCASIQVDRLAGELVPPPDKSISHRAAIVGAMSDGRVRVRGYLRSADTSATLEAVAALGARLVDAQPRGAGLDLELAGAGLRGADPGAAAIDVGNAGTLIRLLPGWLAGQPRGRWALQGDDSIARRPVDRVVHPLRRMGATRRLPRGGTAPVVVEGRTSTASSTSCRSRARR